MGTKSPFRIERLCDVPEALESAAAWFSEKWGIPQECYRESMAEFLRRKAGIPQWYLVRSGEGRILAGAGIIQNDFHERRDLAPNLCALFVEEEVRGRGIARSLLEFARREAGRTGFQTLYLVTEREGFYERCGWTFLGQVACTDGGEARMYAADTL